MFKKIIFSNYSSLILIKYSNFCCFSESVNTKYEIVNQILEQILKRFIISEEKKLFSLINELVTNNFYSCREKIFREKYSTINFNLYHREHCYPCILGDPRHFIGFSILKEEQRYLISIYSNVVPQEVSVHRINNSLSVFDLNEARLSLNLSDPSLTGLGNIGIVFSNQILRAFGYSPLEFFVDEIDCKSGFSFAIPSEYCKDKELSDLSIEV